MAVRVLVQTADIHGLQMGQCDNRQTDMSRAGAVLQLEAKPADPQKLYPLRTGRENEGVVHLEDLGRPIWMHASPMVHHPENKSSLVAD